MHAFGRGGHMAILLGAQIIIADGLLESFPIEKIYAIHKVLGTLVGKVSARPS